jgi:hypothetical protein
MSDFQQVLYICIYTYIHIYGIKGMIFKNKRIKNTFKKFLQKDKSKLPQGIQNKLS